MSWLTLLAVAALFVTDPAGDAHGDGSYVLPTNPAIKAEALDLRSFQATRSGTGMKFTVSYGGVQNPWGLASGFSAGVTDIFVRTAVGGNGTLDDLRLRPASGGWQYHVRVSGAQATLEQAGSAADSPPTRLSAPIAHMQGTSLVIETAIPADEYAYWVTSSVYSPLSKDGLMRPDAGVNPQGLQTARANAPVPVDVLAVAGPGDQAAYSSGLLEPVGQTKDWRPWLLLGLGGLGMLLTLLATVGVWRSR